jgi:hypothetical protein
MKEIEDRLKAKEAELKKLDDIKREKEKRPQLEKQMEIDARLKAKEDEAKRAAQIDAMRRERERKAVEEASELARIKKMKEKEEEEKKRKII